MCPMCMTVAAAAGTGVLGTIALRLRTLRRRITDRK